MLKRDLLRFQAEQLQVKEEENSIKTLVVGTFDKITLVFIKLHVYVTVHNLMPFFNFLINDKGRNLQYTVLESTVSSR